MSIDFDIESPDDGYLEYMIHRQGLPAIFETELDLFPNVSTPKITGRKIKLYDLFQKIKYDLSEDNKPNHIPDILLLDKIVDGKKNHNYDKIKFQFPLVAYNATFSGYKKIENIDHITKLMYLDIDCLQSKAEAEELKYHLIRKYSWIISCYRSFSKIGLHIIIQVDQIRDNNDYNQKYDYINSLYFNGMLDKGAKSLSRFTTIPFDYNIYINSNPQVLEIDKEYQEYKRSLNSVNKEKGRIISTPYTFLEGINTNLNIAARDRGLLFKVPVDENMFTDHNFPLRSNEGIPVVEQNLHPYRYKSVKEGKRTNFIGARTVELLWLNGQTSTEDEIIRYVAWLNKTFCDPPLPHREVVNSVKYNWKKYHTEGLDFSNFYKTKHSFWSPKCTLSANEKRKITCSLNQEFKVMKNMILIEDAIEDLFSDGVKITQKRVSDRTGLAISTVKQKKYWKNVKEMVKEMNQNLKDTQLSNGQVDSKKNIGTDKQMISFPEFISKPNKGVIASPEIFTNHSIIQNPSKKETENVKSLTQKDIELAFISVYERFIDNFDELERQQLFKLFSGLIISKTKQDYKLLLTPIEEIEDSDLFWKRSGLENKCLELLNHIFIK